MFNATPEDVRQVFSALDAGLDNRTLNPVVGKELPLADAVKAHAAVMEPGAYGKIVMIP
jgi:NADPH2:quinone reductase